MATQTMTGYPEMTDNEAAAVINYLNLLRGSGVLKKSMQEADFAAVKMELMRVSNGKVTINRAVT